MNSSNLPVHTSFNKSADGGGPSPSSSIKASRKSKSSSQTTSFGPFRLGRTIGQGEFGKVKVAYHLQSGQEVAIKFVKKLSVDSASRKTKLLREIYILQAISHRYIVLLDQVIETEAYIGLIMEYASGGELFEYILAREFLSESESARLFAQLIDAVTYLHVNGIIHRDLKLENILLDRFRNLKLTDFGFANVVADNTERMLRTSCGSPCYAAPELVVNNEYVGELADIWSCGVILYAMLCGTLPYDDDPNNVNSENLVVLYKYIMETTLKFPVPLSKDARHLVCRILNTNPKLRANLAEIKSHSWLKLYTNTFQVYTKQDSLNIQQPFTHQSPPQSSLPVQIPQPPATRVALSGDDYLQTVPDEEVPLVISQDTVPDVEMAEEEEVKSLPAEKSPIPLEPVTPLYLADNVDLSTPILKAPPNSPSRSLLVQEDEGDQVLAADIICAIELKKQQEPLDGNMSVGSVKLADMIETQTDSVLSEARHLEIASPQDELLVEESPDEPSHDEVSSNQPVHVDLRSQVIPTLEVMTEEDVTVEIVVEESGLASESVAASEEPISDIPMLSKQVSIASSMGSHRLNRKSTTSFMFLEKPSVAHLSSQVVLVEDILADEHSEAVVKIDDELSGAGRVTPATSSNSNSSSSFSSGSPKKVVSFPENDAEEEKTLDECVKSEPKQRSPLRKPRHSLNLNVRQRDSAYFREEALRAQSMDVRRGSETPSMATVMSATSKELGYHSGPIDQRAITIFSPQVVIEKIQLVLLELNLSFAPSSESPYKLIVVKNPSSFGGAERAFHSIDLSRPSFDLHRQPSRASGISRTSMQSSRSAVAAYSSKKQSAGPIGSMFTSLFQKIRYISLFGFQYNRGYDGSTLLPPVRNQNRAEDSFVKFHIVVHKIRFINGIFIVDLKRHKGDIWEFKRLYNEIIVRLDLKGNGVSFV